MRDPSGETAFRDLATLGERPQARTFDRRLGERLRARTFWRVRFAPRLDSLCVQLRDRRRDRLLLLLPLLDRPRLEESDDVDFDDWDEDRFLFPPMVNGLCDFVCEAY